MDEQRIAAYLNLIQELLSCPNGEEGAILSRSSQLLDEGLVIMCQQVAEILRGQGEENQADFLINLAEQLAEYLNMTGNSGEEEESQSDYSVEDYLKFLQQLIQIEIDSNFDRKVVYPFLAQHQNKLDLKFAEIITRWFNSTIDPNNSELNQQLASLFNSIAIDIQQFPLGSRLNNIEIAIACYESALTVRTKDTLPQDWAMTQNNLAAAYSDRIKGSRADNLERAIACYESALTVRTKDALPEQWAMTQNNLAAAYYDRIKGSRADNLERAITCYESALTVYTKDALPEQWAMTQNNLAAAYYDRIKGSRADNLERAIACYESALTVYTKDALPEDWAMTQNNLANAYSDRIKGSRADNLERAIACYESALTVRTKDTLPEDWAMTQNNLANAYSDRIKGSRADNLERAIACYESALTVLTKDALPEQWATTQNNLANAYNNRIKGSRADNLERAIACYESALTVRTKDALPEQWAMTQNNLANAYKNRIKGSRADNLERAITCYESALTVYTKDALPEQWATTQNNLANAYNNRIKGSRADNLERAIACYESALTVYTKDTLPQDWAMTQNNLATAYNNRIKGSRADNLERAITCYESALTVYTKDTLPQNHTETLNNLGFAYQDQSNLYNNDSTKKQTALENAYNTFKEALDVVEYIRGDIIDAEAKTKLNEEWNRLYQGMVQVCLELGKDQEAIEYVDRSKARNLVEQIALSDAYPKGVIPDQDRQRLQELRNLIAEEDRRLQEERRLQQDPNQDSQYINQLRQEYQEKFPYKPVPFNEMQKLLDEKTAILEWYILPGEKILTFIITANSLKLQVFTEEDLDQLGKFGGEYLDAYYSNNNQWYDDLVARMQKLSNILHLPQLLESVFEELPQCEKLILMPHRYLHLFPIHALPVMHNGENKPLQEYFAQGVIYAPNCQLLQQTQKRQYSQFDRLFAIQNPTQDLSGADLELENIRNIFHPDKRNSLQRQYATKTNFLNKDLSQVHHLYFSCHGSSNIEEPLKSGLLLADEVLTLEEIISKLKLNQCSLVTLSACETGQVGIDQTDEYISLASGFILAGATSVLMSLWSVNQVSTAFLLIKTYEYLKEQLEAKQPIQLSIILRDAQNWLRNITIAQLKIWVNNSTLLTDDWRPAIIDYFNGENFVNMLKEHGENYCPYASPFHWAAFCIVGQAELKYFNQENSKMPSDANVIQAFIQLITTNPNDVLNGYWDKLDQLKKGISDDDEKNARSIENWLKQYEKLQQAYNQLLPQNSLQGEGNKIFRVTPSSEESVSLEAMIDQVVKRNTELTENSPQPETTPDTKLDTKTEDSEKPLS